MNVILQRTTTASVYSPTKGLVAADRVGTQQDSSATSVQTAAALCTSQHAQKKTESSFQEASLQKHSCEHDDS
jgi:hypothetical protein